MLKKISLLLVFMVATLHAGEDWPGDLLLRGLRYCSYGDAYGLGVEAWSRERILEHWGELDEGIVYERSPPYDVGLQRGWYSDDTEQSLALAYALHVNAELEPREVFQAFLKAYDDFAQETGAARGGYGSLRHIACLQASLRLAAFERAAFEEGTRPRGPGNASLMCALPLLIDYLQDPEQDPDLLLTNTIAQAFGAGKNYAIAISATLCYLDAVHALWTEQIGFEQIVDYAADFLGARIQQHLLPANHEVAIRSAELAERWELPLHGDASVATERLRTQLQYVEGMPGPGDSRASDLEGRFHEIFGQPPSFLGSQTGVACLAEATLYAVLYQLKWSSEVFEQAAAAGAQAQFHELLKFYLCFGGDTDTVAACCTPVAFIRLEREGHEVQLPQVISESFVEAQHLEPRLRRLLD